MDTLLDFKIDRPVRRQSNMFEVMKRSIIVIALLLIVIVAVIIYIIMSTPVITPPSMPPVQPIVSIVEPEKKSEVKFTKIVKQYHITRTANNEVDINEETSVESNVNNDEFSALVENISKNTGIKHKQDS